MKIGYRSTGLGWAQLGLAGFGWAWFGSMYLLMLALTLKEQPLSGTCCFITEGRTSREAEPNHTNTLKYFSQIWHMVHWPKQGTQPSAKSMQ